MVPLHVVLMKMEVGCECEISDEPSITMIKDCGDIHLPDHRIFADHIPVIKYELIVKRIWIDKEAQNQDCKQAAEVEDF